LILAIPLIVLLTSDQTDLDHPADNLGYRLTMLMVGIWWIGFYYMPWKHLKKRPGKEQLCMRVSLHSRMSYFKHTRAWKALICRACASLTRHSQKRSEYFPLQKTAVASAVTVVVARRAAASAGSVLLDAVVCRDQGGAYIIVYILSRGLCEEAVRPAGRPLRGALVKSARKKVMHRAMSLQLYSENVYVLFSAMRVRSRGSIFVPSFCVKAIMFPCIRARWDREWS
jgi:hypothetical protein